MTPFKVILMMLLANSPGEQPFRRDLQVTSVEQCIKMQELFIKDALANGFNIIAAECLVIVKNPEERDG